MRFSKYAPAVLLPTAAIASANPDVQDGVTLIAVEGVTQEDVHLLVRRQLDLGGIVDGIGDLLGPLFDLLSSESLKKINLIITNLASVLGDLDVQQTRDLLTLLDELINSDATQGLIDTLGSLLPTLLDLLDSDLITKLTNILNNASILLTRDVAEQLNDLITSIGPLFNYIGEFIAFFLDLIFGGGSGGGGGGGGGGGSSTTTRPPTATDTDGPSSTGDRDDPDYSLTLTGGSDSPEATETSGVDWWDSMGLGSSSNSNDDDTDSPSATGDSDSDSGLGWDLGFSNSSDDDDSETVTSGSGEEEDSAGSSDDPGFTGAAGRLQLGAGVSGILGVLITILLL
ncbi:hypothetical protein ASPCAL04759 [Aspergillus calidoustus]|uniref:Uncharacterized protein n=1 Tax=Aspergillus calidoustus TaxID=454130 RepID=A0A0U5FXY3_ASPCI|nr:hypothetical protein ASPCAL04759 [Aspergillus calidoustus]